LTQNETISILGIGKLGICFALNLEKVGYNVVGADINEDYVKKINDKNLVSYEPSVPEFLRESVNFKATTNIYETIEAGSEMIFVCVATPTSEEWGYDHRQVERIVSTIIQFGKAPKRRHLVIVCTTMPGYCDTIAEKLEPYNYTVSYNPEFIAQGNIVHDQQFPDQVLIGEADKEAGDKVQAVYEKLCQNKPVFCRMSRISAEICKLATNCFLTTKISFANSVGDLALKVGAEPDKILSAIGSDSRIGGKYLKYGFGFGGPCFPRDNRALRQFSDAQNYELLISKSTDEVNKRHLEFQTEDYLNRYEENETIVFDHVSYKKGSVLIEESQQLALAVNLAKRGRKVLVKDHPAVIEEVRGIHGDIFQYEPNC
jgi:nucleotide sugar dehydrogenase